MFLVFSTQSDAQIANERIIHNIRGYLREKAPVRLFGDALVSVGTDGNLALGAAKTTNWCEPIKCVEGWAIAKPNQEFMGIIPLSVVLDQVGGQEIESPQFFFEN